MEFCWMDEPGEKQQYDSGRSRQDVAEEDVRERSALLCRLGYSQAEAVHRCLGNVAWAFSVHGKPAITPARVRKLVATVYKLSS